MLMTAILDLSFSSVHSLLYSVPIFSIPIYILFYDISTKVLQYLSAKGVKPKLIPKLDLSDGVKEEQATFVVIPTIVKTKEKVRDIMKKLEVYYLANRSDNLYFALLGDSSNGSRENEPHDKEVIEEGKLCLKELNEKYNKEFPIFHFVYRKRRWNEKEKTFLGWERKRGLLTEFNEFLLDYTKNDFKYNSLSRKSETRGTRSERRNK